MTVAARGLLPMLVAAGFPSAFASGPHKQIDLRHKTDADGEYSISVCARPSPAPGGVPGHMFVTYAEKPTGKERSVLALGYTTSAGVLAGVLSFSSLLSTPTGYLGEEKFTHMQEGCLVMLVNEEDFRKAYSVASPFYNVPALESIKYTGVYSLTSNDCETFATRVVSSLGLKVPPRATTDLPLGYVRKLIDSN